MDGIANNDNLVQDVTMVGMANNDNMVQDVTMVGMANNDNMVEQRLFCGGQASLHYRRD